MKLSLNKNLGHDISVDPFLDWVIILAGALAVALILVGVGVSVYLGTQASLAAPASVSAARPALPLDQAALYKVIGDFSARSESRAEALGQWSPPGDPSLP